MDDIPSWLAGAFFGAVFAVIAMGILRRGNSSAGGDMIERQRRSAHSATSPANDAEILNHPEIRAAIDGRQKILAIKLVRDRFGLGLREAKELVERAGPR